MSSVRGVQLHRGKHGTAVARPKSKNRVSQVEAKLIITSDGREEPVFVPKLREEADCRKAAKAMSHAMHTMANSHGSSDSRERLHKQGGVFDKVGLGGSVAAQAGLARTGGGSDRARQMVAQSHAASGAHARAPRETKTEEVVASGALAAVSDPNRESVINRDLKRLFSDHAQATFQQGQRAYKKTRPQEVPAGSFYASSSSCPRGWGATHAKTPERTNRSSRTRPGTLHSTATAKKAEQIDLTLESDDDAKVEEEDEFFSDLFQGKRKRRECGSAGSGEGGEPTREDLLAITGSADSSTSMEDTVQTTSASRDEVIFLSEEQKRGQCEFLRKHFLGMDGDVLERCTRRKPEANRRKGGVVCSIRGGGMGAFDLTNAQLKCLKASEWLNDEVINAYMSLLSLRSIVRCKKYLEGLADGAGNEGDETDQELQEVGDTDREQELQGVGDTDKEQELEGVGDADREQDAIGCDGPQQEKKTAERDQRRARRRGDAFSGSSDDGQLRFKEAQESDKENTASKPPPNCAFFSSFFYAILRNAKGGYDFDNVRRWSRNKNLEEADIILFPINISNAHWCLAAVYPKEKRIRYFDSLGGRNGKCVDTLQSYMQDEGKARGIHAWAGEWQKEHAKPPQDCPKQFDGVSCGVFVCCFADCLSGDASLLSFKQEDMRDIRTEVHRVMSSCNM